MDNEYGAVSCCLLIKSMHQNFMFQVKNLRSQVARLAMVCLRELYTNLKKNMDSVC